MIIGIVIIGFGTSVPEIFVASNAVINNSSDITLGSVGSNIANILSVFSFGLITAAIILKVVSIGDMFAMLVAIFVSIFLITGSIKTPLSFLMIYHQHIFIVFNFFNKT